jgi:hypothetical protein
VRRTLRNLQMSFEKLQEPAKASEIATLLGILEESTTEAEEE